MDLLALFILLVAVVPAADGKAGWTIALCMLAFWIAG